MLQCCKVQSKRPTSSQVTVGAQQNESSFLLSDWRFNSRATGTLYRRTQGSSLTGLESSWANQRARCLPEVRNWHGKGSCCGLTLCQKASWECFERRCWLLGCNISSSIVVRKLAGNASKAEDALKLVASLTLETGNCAWNRANQSARS